MSLGAPLKLLFFRTRQGYILSSNRVKSAAPVKIRPGIKLDFYLSVSWPFPTHPSPIPAWNRVNVSGKRLVNSAKSYRLDGHDNERTNERAKLVLGKFATR